MASSDRLMGLGRCGPVAGADGVMPTARYRGPPMTLANMRENGRAQAGRSRGLLPVGERALEFALGTS
jgi:hypothetical protein